MAKYSSNGVINRPSLKAAAREKIKGNLWNIWKALLVFVAVGSVLGYIQGLLGEESTASRIVAVLIEIAILPLSAGLVLYILNFVRGKKYDIHDLLTYYDKRVLNLLLLEIVVGLFTFLWSLLFIIPGIIAALSYSMYLYIYIDEIKKEPMEVIRESKRMMDGYKWDYFVFQLSFLGWGLLVAITFGIAAIYVIPYQSVAQAMYYEELKAIKG